MAQAPQGEENTQGLFSHRCLLLSDLLNHLQGSTLNYSTGSRKQRGGVYCV